MREEDVIEYIKNNINELSNIKDLSDNDFEHESRFFILKLKEFGKTFHIPDLLKKAGLNSKEKIAIEEACQVKESNVATLLIKKAIEKREEDEINQELKNLSDWFDSGNCYRSCYSKQEDFQGINKDFFNRFKNDVLPHIKKENYAALFIYLKSGNLKEDILNDIYKKNDNTIEIQKKVRERINELLIPIRIERKEGIIENLIVEDSNISFLNKNNIAKSGYIDVVMKSPLEKKLFISEVTANKIYDDIHDHIGSRNLLDPHIKRLEKNSGYSIERYDFYKGVQKSFIDKNIKEFEGKNDLINNLFIFLNSNVNNLVNYKNKNTTKIQMFGSSESKMLNNKSDIYEDFNNFLKKVTQNYNKIDSQLKPDIRNALVESSKWIMKNMDLETSPEVISKHRKTIELENIEKCIKLFNIEGVSNQNLDLLQVKIEEQEDSTPEVKALRNLKRIKRTNKEDIHNEGTCTKEYFLNKMSLHKFGIEMNFDIIESFLMEISKNQGLLPLYRNRATKTLNGIEVKSYSDEESLIYKTYLKFRDLGFSNKNQLSYTNKKVKIEDKDIYDLYFIAESLTVFSSNIYNFDLKKDGIIGRNNFENRDAESYYEVAIHLEDTIEYFKELDNSYDYLKNINVYFNILKNNKSHNASIDIWTNICNVYMLEYGSLYRHIQQETITDRIIDTDLMCKKGFSLIKFDLDKTKKFKEEIKYDLNKKEDLKVEDINNILNSKKNKKLKNH